jgi:hypothetical protein
VRKVAVEHASEPGWAFVRELRGDDEEAVRATDSEAAIALLDRLLVEHPGAVVGPGRACELTIPDRDQALAALQLAELGRRVESTVTCAACAQPYDIDFDLAALIESVRRDSASAEAAPALRERPGVYRMPAPDGRSFRLPSGVDERAVAALGPGDAPRALLRRCVVDGSIDADGDVDAFGETMRAVGPLIDVEVGAACAECGHAQSVRFDLQHYVLSTILDGGRQRAREVHQIAMAYRWSLAEILSLPRSRRRLYAELIERDAVAR